MPRPTQTYTWKEFKGEYDGVSIEAFDGQASSLQNLIPNADLRGLRRRGGSSVHVNGPLTPDDQFDGMLCYTIGATDHRVVAQNGRLYDWDAVAQVTNSSGKLTAGEPAHGAWVDSRVYWGDGIEHNIRHNGLRADQAMVTPVLAGPSVAVGAAGGPTGTYTYKITFVSADGFDSEPGPASASVTVSNQKVSLTNIPTASAGQDCSARRIWRIKNGGTIYYLVDEIADNSTTTYTDSTTDANLSVEISLIEGNTMFPPCRYLIAHQNRLIGAYSTTEENGLQQVFISNYREPYYCPLVPDLDDPNQGTRIFLQGPAAGVITGLCSHGDKIAVFTHSGAFLLQTSDQLLDYQIHLFTTHGCVAHRTIWSVQDMLIWLGHDGVYAAREGQSVARVSDDMRDTIATVTPAMKALAHAYVFQGRYVLCWPDGAIWWDLRTGIWGSYAGQLWNVSAVRYLRTQEGPDESVFVGEAGLGLEWHAEREDLTTDDGDPIVTIWKSKATDLGAPYREKRLHSVDCKWKTGETGMSATVKVYRDGGSTAIQTATKDLSDVGETGAPYVSLDQRCNEKARGEFFEIEVRCEAENAVPYQLLQVDARYHVVT